MMQVLKLNVNYSGYYGGDVDETMLLPIDVNGVFFEELESGEYEDAVYLGEIEGKHSEVHGDLVVDIVDLDELTLKEVSDLIEESSFGQFDGYFDVAWDEIDEEDDEYDKEKAESIRKKYSVDADSWKSDIEQIHSIFIDELKSKYVKSFKIFNVLDSDYENVVKILSDNGIKTYN